MVKMVSCMLRIFPYVYRVAIKKSLHMSLHMLRNICCKFYVAYIVLQLKIKKKISQPNL